MTLLYAATFVVTFIGSPVIGFFVFLNNPRRKFNILWALFQLFVCVWAVGRFGMLLSTDRESALFWCRMLYFGSIILYVLFFHSIIVFLERERPLQLLIGFAYLAGTVLILCNAVDLFFKTNFFVSDAVPKMAFNFYEKPGWFYHLQTFLNVTIPLVIFHEIYKAYRYAASYKQRNQYLYLLLASLVGFSGGSTILPLVYGYEVPPIGIPIIPLYFVALTYGMFRYQLMDIEVIIKRSIVFAGLFAMVMASVGLVTTVLQQVVGRHLPVHPFVSMTLSAFAAILFYDPTKKWLVHVTEEVLFQQEIDYGKIDREIADQIQITDLQEQTRNIVEIFRKGFVLDNAAILLLDEEKKAFRFARREGGNIGGDLEELREQDESIQTIKEYPGQVALASSLPKDRRGVLSAWLAALKTEALCKIQFKDRLIALLLLGHKKSDREYTQKDTDFLERVSKSLGVAINNAKAFKFKEDYFVLMAEKNKTDVLARLSQGIDHEIKNPLNAIKPAAQRTQMMMEKLKAGRPEAFQSLENYLQMIIRNCDRMVAIMTRLRNFAQPIKEAGDFKLKPLSLKEAVEDALELVSKKQLEIDGIAVVNQIDPDIRIFGERASVVQVFWNLIMNAYHAVDRNGRIEISGNVSKNDGKVIVAVADTGSGISPENIDKIFTPFFTTKPTNLSPESNERFTGTGLGLCYVKQYVEGLGGSIACASEVGKGTTFYLKFLRAENGQKANQNISG